MLVYKLRAALAPLAFRSSPQNVPSQAQLGSPLSVRLSRNERYPRLGGRVIAKQLGLIHHGAGSIQPLRFAADRSRSPCRAV